MGSILVEWFSNEWDKPDMFEYIKLCFLLLDSDSPTTGLYFMLKTEILENSLFFLNIGPQASNRNLSGSTIVCVTTNINTACCRSADNNGMTNATAGAVGEWRYPNGTSVPRLSDNNVMDFARVGFTQQVRLARVVELGSTPPLGVYTCEVPELSTGILHTASITITNGKYYLVMFSCKWNE